MLISPWVPAGTVFQRPTGPYATSEFDLTSMCSTAKNLFGLKGFLTRRDAWAGSFHELLTLDTPRTDAPLHLPDAPEGGAGRRRALGEGGGGSGGGGGPGRHCSANAANACAMDGMITQRSVFNGRILISY